MAAVFVVESLPWQKGLVEPLKQQSAGRRRRRRRPLGCTGWVIVLIILCAALVATGLALGLTPNLMMR